MRLIIGGDEKNRNVTTLFVGTRERKTSCTSCGNPRNLNAREILAEEEASAQKLHSFLISDRVSLAFYRKLRHLMESY